MFSILSLFVHNTSVIQCLFGILISTSWFSTVTEILPSAVANACTIQSVLHCLLCYLAVTCYALETDGLDLSS